MKSLGDIERVRGAVSDLLASQYFAVLCTRSETHPYCSLVGFAATGDLRRIVLATMKDTRKFRNLSSDGRVSLMIDSRTNRVEDLSEASAVTVLGEVGGVDKAEESPHRELYLRRHPHLESFLDDPNTVIVCVDVSKYILVSRFQEVLELEIR